MHDSHADCAEDCFEIDVRTCSHRLENLRVQITFILHGGAQVILALQPRDHSNVSLNVLWTDAVADDGVRYPKTPNRLMDLCSMYIRPPTVTKTFSVPGSATRDLCVQESTRRTVSMPRRRVCGPSIGGSVCAIRHDQVMPMLGSSRDRLRRAVCLGRSFHRTRWRMSPSRLPSALSDAYSETRERGRNARVLQHCVCLVCAHASNAQKTSASVGS